MTDRPIALLDIKVPWSKCYTSTPGLPLASSLVATKGMK